MGATSQYKEKFEDYEGFVEKFKPKEQPPKEQPCRNESSKLSNL